MARSRLSRGRRESCLAGGQSFTANTKVLTASGALVAISKLKPGQKVLATSTKTGKTQAEPVAAVLVRYDKDLYDLKVRAGSKTSVIKTTRSHLFWNQATHRWAKAGSLKYGTHLRTPSGGSATVAGGWTPKVTTGWMWDLTIPTDHDFYIQAVTTEVLVHNVNRSCGDAAEEGEGPVQPYDVGTYNKLQARSEVGDQLDIHHVPQAQPAGQVVEGYSYGEAPAIALPAEEHALIPNLRGFYPGTAEELLERDIGNLRNFTNAPETSIQQLIGLVRNTYPGTFGGE